MIVQLHYVDDQIENTEWQNGVHFANFATQSDVPNSTFALSTSEGRQVRYLSIAPKRPDVEIRSIEFIKGADDKTSPAVIAITAELSEKASMSGTGKP